MTTDDVAVPLPDEPIVVHWRPGCGFCSSLLRGLERHGLEFARVDIWQEPDAAAFVRSVTGGSETVPTVRVGEVALINPTATEVLREVAERAPQRLPEGFEVPEAGRLQRAVRRLLGG